MNILLNFAPWICVWKVLGSLFPKVSYETMNLFGNNEVMELDSIDDFDHNVKQNKFQKSSVPLGWREYISIYAATPSDIGGYK